MQRYLPVLRRLSAFVFCWAMACGPALAQSAAVTHPATPGGAWAATRTKAHAQAYQVATDAGALSTADSVHVAVSLQLRDRGTLSALTDKLSSGATAQALTSQQFLDRHAPTLEQATRVATYLRSNGFQNVTIAPNRMLVTADGSPGQIRAAFQADMHAFNVNGRRAFANVTDALVPTSLSDTVLAVIGLQTVHLAHTNARRFVPQALSPEAVTGVSPPLFASIYGANGMPSASTATIGIITQGSMGQTVADLNAFAASAGYPAPPVSVITVGSASTDTSGLDEWNLDTQASLAAAGGSVRSMLLYTATTLSDANLTTAFNRAVSDNLAKVINVSLGECETSASSTGLEASNDQIFQAAVAQGQTFSVSSGDSGAYECGGSSNAQSYPAVSPYVMAIGGTTLSSSGGTWVSETAWSCANFRTCPQSASGGTGGGVSLTEAAPSWQTAAGVLTTVGKRGVPDISFDASPSSGALILINGSNVQIGGTSLSAPLFTGFYARIQSAHGNSLGFPASALYAGAASNPSWFHDVTSGSNGGYAAAPGWDYVTGYGSLQVQNFSSALGATATDTWTPIASEGQSFTVTGTQTVRYGAGSNWITLSVTGGGTCSNAFFGGDPAYGTVKQCQVSGSAPAQVTWTQIASEGQAFTVNGTQTVRYGAGSSWVTLNVTGGGTCSNAFFGSDPAYGTLKQCQIASTVQASWTQIANEGQTFTLSGTHNVRYGKDSAWTILSLTSGGTCSNAFFGGDPAPGVVKECDVAN